MSLLTRVESIYTQYPRFARQFVEFLILVIAMTICFGFAMPKVTAAVADYKAENNISQTQGVAVSEIMSFN